ncbi:ATP-binding protein [Adlercreutzia rubneri]
MRTGEVGTVGRNRGVPGTKRLSAKLVLAITVVVAVCAVVFLAWTQSNQEEAIRSKVLVEARTLNTEMRAVWNYIDDAQPSININADGTYDFKGIYCSVAGKGIAKRFTRESDNYVIRYVRENPRSGTDEPDSFEQVALNHFTVGGATEHYELTDYEGRPVFRYASVLPIKPNCLPCHGEPAGTPDETGFLREGMELGDVAGAVSIIIPADAHIKEARRELASSVLFFCVLAAAIATVVFVAVRRWVAAPLARANAQLEAESKQKSDFLAIMSHELRTPLTSIIAFTDIWEKAPEGGAIDQARLVAEIKQNSTHLLEMVNNTIDVARLEAGRMEIQCEETDLLDVLGTVFAVADPIALKRGIKLEREIDYSIPIMLTDDEALRKILLNLVGNALKFTEPGGTVRVRAERNKAAGTVVLSVEDAGCGIPETDFERIFGKFSQTARDGNVETGSGLGLFLVRSLAEKLGGAVSLASEVGCGSTFAVTIPLATCEDIEEREEE